MRRVKGSDNFVDSVDHLYVTKTLVLFLRTILSFFTVKPLFIIGRMKSQIICNGGVPIDLMINLSAELASVPVTTYFINSRLGTPLESTE